MAPFTRVFANILGTGRWFDTYVPNLVPVPGGAGGDAAAMPAHAPMPARERARVGLVGRAGRRARRRRPGGRRVMLLAAVRTVRVTRLLHPCGRPLPGLGRAHPRRPGRRGDRGRAAGRDGAGRARVRRRVQGARGRPGGRHRPSVVSDRYVQLTARLHRRPDLADGARDPARAHRGPGRARPHLREPRRPDVALGPEGANNDGALLAPARGRAPPTSTARARTSTTRSRTSRWRVDALATAGDDLFGTVRTCRPSRHAGRERRPGAPLNANLARVSDQLAGEREDLAPALPNLAVALERGVDVRPGEPRRC